MNAAQHHAPLKRFMQPFFSFVFREITNTKTTSDYFEPLIRGWFRKDYRSGLMPAQLDSVSKLSDNLYTVTLKLKGNMSYDFRPGQFVQIEVDINGRRYQRCFSISSSPRETRSSGLIEMTIRHIPGGIVTEHLTHSLRKGDTIHLSQAMGDFVLSSSNPARLFIAGGSGISPILSMLKSLPLSNDRNTLVFYHRGTPERALLKKLREIEQLGIHVKVFDTRKDGHFSHDHLESLKQKELFEEAYLCGPEAMIRSCKATLEKQGLNRGSIFYELFGESQSTAHAIPESDEAITLEFTQTRLTVQVNKGEQGANLLTLAESAGMNPQSGCRIGVCRQCVCKKKSGLVYNVKTGQTSDKAAEEIQLCQSIALSHLVIDI